MVDWTSLAWGAAILLAAAIALLPPLQALAAVGVLYALALGALRPAWAIALVFLAIPLELLSINVGAVGLSAVQIVTLLVVGMMLVEMMATGRWELMKTPLDVPAFVWCATLFLGAVGSLDPVAAVKKAGMTVLFLAIYYLVVAKIRRLESVAILMKALVAGCAVVGAYGIWISYRYIATGIGAGKGIIVGSEGLALPRAGSTLGDPTLLAALMVIATPIAIMLVATTKGWQRFFSIVACATVLVALGFTFTRGAWIGALAAFAVLLFERRSRRVLLVVLVLLVLLSPAAILDRAATSTQFGRAEISHRFDYWEGAVMLAPTRPVFGIGLNNYPRNFARLPVSETSQRFASHAHNVVLVLMSETGLVGLFSFGALILGMLVLLLRRRRHDASEGRRLWRLAIAAALVGTLAHQMTDSFLLEPTFNSVLWVFAGLAVLLGLGTIEADDDPAMRTESAT